MTETTTIPTSAAQPEERWDVRARDAMRDMDVLMRTGGRPDENETEASGRAAAYRAARGAIATGWLRSPASTPAGLWMRNADAAIALHALRAPEEPTSRTDWLTGFAVAEWRILHLLRARHLFVGDRTPDTRDRAGAVEHALVRRSEYGREAGPRPRVFRVLHDRLVAVMWSSRLTGESISATVYDGSTMDLVGTRDITKPTFGTPVLSWTTRASRQPPGLRLAIARDVRAQIQENMELLVQHGLGQAT